MSHFLYFYITVVFQNRLIGEAPIFVKPKGENGKAGFKSDDGVEGVEGVVVATDAIAPKLSA